MPAIYEDEIVKRITGLICDKCGYVDHNNCNTYHVNYGFGYGTILDQSRVIFSLCDECLIDIVTKHIPNAKFYDNEEEIQVTKTDVIKVTYLKNDKI